MSERKWWWGKCDPVSAYSPRTGTLGQTRLMLAFVLLSGAVIAVGCNAAAEDASVQKGAAQRDGKAEVLQEAAQQPEQPANERLHAFERPDPERVQFAVYGVWYVFGVAGIGIILLFIGTALYYSQPSWTKPYKPTEVIRAPGVEPKPRGSSDSEHRRYNLDED